MKLKNKIFIGFALSSSFIVASSTILLTSCSNSNDSNTNDESNTNIVIEQPQAEAISTKLNQLISAETINIENLKTNI